MSYSEYDMGRGWRHPDVNGWIESNSSKIIELNASNESVRDQRPASCQACSAIHPTGTKPNCGQIYIYDRRLKSEAREHYFDHFLSWWLVQVLSTCTCPQTSNHFICFDPTLFKDEILCVSCVCRCAGSGLYRSTDNSSGFSTYYKYHTDSEAFYLYYVHIDD